MNVRVSRRLEEELAWIIDKRLRDISNKMLFKSVLPYFGNNSMQKYFRPNLDVRKFIYRKFLLCESFGGDTCHGVV